ncbi:MAG: hypothetical protein DRP58_06640 [Spirochaetes bacterium]|nr:MAG: hypothetical protein DRP58_06640 [Spirochaetota bacterium]
MADEKISELPELADTSVTDADIIPIVAGGVTHKVPKASYLKTITDAITSITNTLAAGAFNFISFTPQGTAPAHLEGRLFYGNNALNLQSDIDGVTLQVGQEQVIRVINRTGVTIPNGFALRQDGHDAVTNRMKVVLAKADLFTTATVIGVATHDILNDAEGYITTFGKVGEVDITTAGIAETGVTIQDGSILYLSATEAGKVTTIAPDIATRLGGALVVTGSTADILIKPVNILTLPTIYGELASGSAGATLAADTYQAVVNYASGNNLAMPVNTAAGTINVPTTGKYRFTINIVMNFDTIGNTTEDLFLGISDGTSIVAEIKDFLAKDSAAGSFYPAILFDAIAGEDYHLELKCSDTLTNIVYSVSNFDIQSVHIR